MNQVDTIRTKWYKGCMVLNVRNVPDALMKKLKSDAALNGQTLRDYVIERLDSEESVAQSGRAPKPARESGLVSRSAERQAGEVAGSNPAASPKPKKTMFPNLPVMGEK